MTVATRTPGLRTLAEGIVRWLASHQQPDGNLRDPVSGTPLPPEHYGTVLFAAASGLVEGKASPGAAAERAIRYYLRLPRSARGAHELNNLGLLCVSRLAQGSHVVRSLETAIAAHLRRMPFASLTSHSTNNWSAMRAVCLAQRARLFRSAGDAHAARVFMHRHVLPMQGPDGLFADYPPAGRGGDRATPLTYHAKICAMLAMFLQEIEDGAAADALGRGVTVLAQLCAPDGQALYFGRSCNSIYGYASALYATASALGHGTVPTADRALVAQAQARMVDFLLRMRQPDGSLRPYPTEFDAERLGWDDYVERLDYNAFTAFLLLQIPSQPFHAEAPHRPATFTARQAGLIVRERDGVFAAFSTRGQLNAGSYMFTDARYAGIQPLLLQYDGRTIIPPPPHDAGSPTDPSWVGFMPVVSIGGEVWAVRTYNDVRTADGEILAVVGRGTPVTMRTGLRRRILARAGRSAGRPARALVWTAARFIHPLRALTPRACTIIPAPGIQVRRALVLLPRFRCLCMVERVDGQFDRGWSTIRLPGPCSPHRDGYRFAIGGGLEGRIWIPHPSGDSEIRQVFTSNGPAYVLRLPVSPGTVHVSAVCFGPEVSLSMESGRESQTVITLRQESQTFRIALDLDALKVTGE